MTVTAHTHTLLTTLIVWLVVVLEQSLPRVPEEGSPRDCLDEAKVGVVLDKDYSIADLLQRTQAQGGDGEVLQSQGIDTTAKRQIPS